MEEKQREQKRARTVRSDYLADVDEVQAWIRQAELKVQDRSVEPMKLREHLRQIQNELGPITDKLERLTRNGRVINENTRDENEKEIIESTVLNLTEQLAQVRNWLEEKKQLVGDTLDAWQRFLTLYEAVKAWTEEKKQFLVEPLKLSTLVQTRQRLHEYSTAVKSCKQVNKNLSDMGKELESIGQVTSVGDLPEKLQEAEEGKVHVEGQLLERNALLQETSEEWEQCERKMKDVRSWMEKAKQTLESPQNKKKPLRDQHAIREKMLSDISIQKTKITISVEKLQVHFRSGIGGDSKVSDTADQLLAELDVLHDNVKDQTTSLEACLAQIEQYQQEIQHLRQQIVQVEQQLRTVLSPTYLPNDREKALQEQQSLQTRMEGWRQRSRSLLDQIHAVDPYYVPSNEFKVAGQASYADIAAGRTSPNSRGCSPFRTQGEEPPPPSTPLAIQVLRPTAQRHISQKLNTDSAQDEPQEKRAVEPSVERSSDVASTAEEPPVITEKKAKETKENLEILKIPRRGRSPTRRSDQSRKETQRPKEVPSLQVEVAVSENTQEPADENRETLSQSNLSAQTTLAPKEQRRGRSPSPMWVPGSTSYADVLRGCVHDSSSRASSVEPVTHEMVQLQSKDSRHRVESQQDVLTPVEVKVTEAQISETTEMVQTQETVPDQRNLTDLTSQNVVPNVRGMDYQSQMPMPMESTSINQNYTKQTTNWSNEALNSYNMLDSKTYQNVSRPPPVPEMYDYVHPPMPELVGFIGSQLGAYPVAPYVYAPTGHPLEPSVQTLEPIPLNPYETHIGYSTEHYVPPPGYLPQTDMYQQTAIIQQTLPTQQQQEQLPSCELPQNAKIMNVEEITVHSQVPMSLDVSDVVAPVPLQVSDVNEEVVVHETAEKSATDEKPSVPTEQKDSSPSSAGENKGQTFSYAQILSQGLSSRVTTSPPNVKPSTEQRIKERSYSPREPTPPQEPKTHEFREIVDTKPQQTKQVRGSEWDTMKKRESKKKQQQSQQTQQQPQRPTEKVKQVEEKKVYKTSEKVGEKVQLEKQSPPKQIEVQIKSSKPQEDVQKEDKPPQQQQKPQKRVDEQKSEVTVPHERKRKQKKKRADNKSVDDEIDKALKEIEDMEKQKGKTHKDKSKETVKAGVASVDVAEEPKTEIEKKVSKTADKSKKQSKVKEEKQSPLPAFTDNNRSDAKDIVESMDLQGESKAVKSDGKEKQKIKTGIDGTSITESPMVVETQQENGSKVKSKGKVKQKTLIQEDTKDKNKDAQKENILPKELNATTVQKEKDEKVISQNGQDSQIIGKDKTKPEEQQTKLKDEKSQQDGKADSKPTKNKKKDNKKSKAEIKLENQGEVKKDNKLIIEQVHDTNLIAEETDSQKEVADIKKKSSEYKEQVSQLKTQKADKITMQSKKIESSLEEEKIVLKPETLQVTTTQTSVKGAVAEDVKGKVPSNKKEKSVTKQVEKAVEIVEKTIEMSGSGEPNKIDTEDNVTKETIPQQKNEDNEDKPIKDGVKDVRKDIVAKVEESSVESKNRHNKNVKTEEKGKKAKIPTKVDAKSKDQDKASAKPEIIEKLEKPSTEVSIVETTVKDILPVLNETVTVNLSTSTTTTVTENVNKVEVTQLATETEQIPTGKLEKENEKEFTSEQTTVSVENKRSSVSDNKNVSVVESKIDSGVLTEMNKSEESPELKYEKERRKVTSADKTEVVSDTPKSGAAHIDVKIETAQLVERKSEKKESIKQLEPTQLIEQKSEKKENIKQGVPEDRIESSDKQAIDVKNKADLIPEDKTTQPSTPAQKSAKEDTEQKESMKPKEKGTSTKCPVSPKQIVEQKKPSSSFNVKFEEEIVFKDSTQKDNNSSKPTSPLKEQTKKANEKKYAQAGVPSDDTKKQDTLKKEEEEAALKGKVETKVLSEERQTGKAVIIEKTVTTVTTTTSTGSAEVKPPAITSVKSVEILENVPLPQIAGSKPTELISLRPESVEASLTTTYARVSSDLLVNSPPEEPSSGQVVSSLELGPSSIPISPTEVILIDEPPLFGSVQDRKKGSAKPKSRGSSQKPETKQDTLLTDTTESAFVKSVDDKLKKKQPSASQSESFIIREREQLGAESLQKQGKVGDVKEVVQEPKQGIVEASNKNAVVTVEESTKSSLEKTVKTDIKVVADEVSEPVAKPVDNKSEKEVLPEESSSVKVELKSSEVIKEVETKKVDKQDEKKVEVSTEKVTESLKGTSFVEKGLVSKAEEKVEKGIEESSGEEEKVSEEKDIVVDQESDAPSEKRASYYEAEVILPYWMDYHYYRQAECEFYKHYKVVKVVEQARPPPSATKRRAESLERIIQESVMKDSKEKKTLSKEESRIHALVFDAPKYPIISFYEFESQWVKSRQSTVSSYTTSPSEESTTEIIKDSPQEQEQNELLKIEECPVVTTKTEEELIKISSDEIVENARVVEEAIEDSKSEVITATLSCEKEDAKPVQSVHLVSDDTWMSILDESMVIEDEEFSGEQLVKEEKNEIVEISSTVRKEDAKPAQSVHLISDDSWMSVLDEPMVIEDDEFDEVQQTVTPSTNILVSESQEAHKTEQPSVDSKVIQDNTEISTESQAVSVSENVKVDQQITNIKEITVRNEKLEPVISEKQKGTVEIVTSGDKPENIQQLKDLSVEEIQENKSIGKVEADTDKEIEGEECGIKDQKLKSEAQVLKEDEKKPDGKEPGKGKAVKESKKQGKKNKGKEKVSEDADGKQEVKEKDQDVKETTPKVENKQDDTLKEDLKPEKKEDKDEEKNKKTTETKDTKPEVNNKENMKPQKKSKRKEPRMDAAKQEAQEKVPEVKKEEDTKNKKEILDERKVEIHKVHKEDLTSEKKKQTVVQTDEKLTEITEQENKEKREGEGNNMKAEIKEEKTCEEVLKMIETGDKKGEIIVEDMKGQHEESTNQKDSQVIDIRLEPEKKKQKAKEKESKIKKLKEDTKENVEDISEKEDQMMQKKQPEIEQADDKTGEIEEDKAEISKQSPKTQKKETKGKHKDSKVREPKQETKEKISEVKEDLKLPKQETEIKHEVQQTADVKEEVKEKESESSKEPSKTQKKEAKGKQKESKAKESKHETREKIAETTEDLKEQSIKHEDQQTSVAEEEAKEKEPEITKEQRKTEDSKEDIKHEEAKEKVKEKETIPIKDEEKAQEPKEEITQKHKTDGVKLEMKEEEAAVVKEDPKTQGKENEIKQKDYKPEEPKQATEEKELIVTEGNLKSKEKKKQDKQKSGKGKGTKQDIKEKESITTKENKQEDLKPEEVKQEIQENKAAIIEEERKQQEVKSEVTLECQKTEEIKHETTENESAVSTGNIKPQEKKQDKQKGGKGKGPKQGMKEKELTVDKEILEIQGNKDVLKPQEKEEDLKETNQEDAKKDITVKKIEQEVEQKDVEVKEVEEKPKEEIQPIATDSTKTDEKELVTEVKATEKQESKAKVTEEVPAIIPQDSKPRKDKHKKQEKHKKDVNDLKPKDETVSKEEEVLAESTSKIKDEDVPEKPDRKSKKQVEKSESTTAEKPGKKKLEAEVKKDNISDLQVESITTEEQVSKLPVIKDTPLTSECPSNEREVTEADSKLNPNVKSWAAIVASKETVETHVDHPQRASSNASPVVQESTAVDSKPIEKIQTSTEQMLEDVQVKQLQAPQSPQTKSPKKHKKKHAVTELKVEQPAKAVVQENDKSEKSASLEKTVELLETTVTKQPGKLYSEVAASSRRTSPQLVQEDRYIVKPVPLRAEQNVHKVTELKETAPEITSSAETIVNQTSEDVKPVELITALEKELEVERTRELKDPVKPEATLWAEEVEEEIAETSDSNIPVINLAPDSKSNLSESENASLLEATSWAAIVAKKSLETTCAFSPPIVDQLPVKKEVQQRPPPQIHVEEVPQPEPIENVVQVDDQGFMEFVNRRELRSRRSRSRSRSGRRDDKRTHVETVHEDTKPQISAADASDRTLGKDSDQTQTEEPVKTDAKKPAEKIGDKNEKTNKQKSSKQKGKDRSKSKEVEKQPKKVENVSEKTQKLTRKDDTEKQSASDEAQVKPDDSAEEKSGKVSEETRKPETHKKSKKADEQKKSKEPSDQKQHDKVTKEKPKESKDKIDLPQISLDKSEEKQIPSPDENTDITNTEQKAQQNQNFSKKSKKSKAKKGKDVKEQKNDGVVKAEKVKPTETVLEETVKVVIETKASEDSSKQTDKASEDVNKIADSSTNGKPGETVSEDIVKVVTETKTSEESSNQTDKPSEDVSKVTDSSTDVESVVDVIVPQKEDTLDNYIPEVREKQETTTKKKSKNKKGKANKQTTSAVTTEIVNKQESKPDARVEEEKKMEKPSAMDSEIKAKAEVRGTGVEDKLIVDNQQDSQTLKDAEKISPKETQSHDELTVPEKISPQQDNVEKSTDLKDSSIDVIVTEKPTGNIQVTSEIHLEKESSTIETMESKPEATPTDPTHSDSVHPIVVKDDEEKVKVEDKPEPQENLTTPLKEETPPAADDKSKKKSKSKSKKGKRQDEPKIGTETKSDSKPDIPESKVSVPGEKMAEDSVDKSVQEPKVVSEDKEQRENKQKDVEETSEITSEEKIDVIPAKVSDADLVKESGVVQEVSQESLDLKTADKEIPITKDQTPEEQRIETKSKKTVAKKQDVEKIADVTKETKSVDVTDVSKITEMKQACQDSAKIPEQSHTQDTSKASVKEETSEAKSTAKKDKSKKRHAEKATEEVKKLEQKEEDFKSSGNVSVVESSEQIKTTETSENKEEIKPSAEKSLTAPSQKDDTQTAKKQHDESKPKSKKDKAKKQNAAHEDNKKTNTEPGEGEETIIIEIDKSKIRIEPDEIILEISDTEIKTEKEESTSVKAADIASVSEKESVIFKKEISENLIETSEISPAEKEQPVMFEKEEIEELLEATPATFEEVPTSIFEKEMEKEQPFEEIESVITSDDSENVPSCEPLEESPKSKVQFYIADEILVLSPEKRKDVHIPLIESEPAESSYSKFLSLDCGFWPDKHLYHEAERDLFERLSSLRKEDPVKDKRESDDRDPPNPDNDRDGGNFGGGGGGTRGSFENSLLNGSPRTERLVADLPGGICSWSDYSTYLSVECDLKPAGSSRLANDTDRILENTSVDATMSSNGSSDHSPNTSKVELDRNNELMNTGSWNPLSDEPPVVSTTNQTREPTAAFEAITIENPRDNVSREVERIDGNVRARENSLELLSTAVCPSDEIIPVWSDPSMNKSSENELRLDHTTQLVRKMTEDLIDSERSGTSDGHPPPSPLPTMLTPIHYGPESKLHLGRKMQESAQRWDLAGKAHTQTGTRQDEAEKRILWIKATIEERLEALKSALANIEENVGYLPRDSVQSMLSALTTVLAELRLYDQESSRLYGELREVPADSESQKLSSTLTLIRRRILYLLTQAEQGYATLEQAREFQERRLQEVETYRAILDETDAWLKNIVPKLIEEQSATGTKALQEELLSRAQQVSELESSPEVSGLAKTLKAALLEVLTRLQHKQQVSIAYQKMGRFALFAPLHPTVA